MATSTRASVTVQAGGSGVTFPSSMQINWTQVHTDAERVNSGAQLLNPGSVSNAYVIPAIVSQGTRLRIIARTNYAVATVTTSPVVRIYGANDVPNSSGAFPAGTIFHRIDSENFADTGLTLTLDVAANVQNDGATYCWSSPQPVSTGFDMLGAKAVVVLIQTAADVDVGTVPLYIALLN